jgi:CheY-like chemotaxis protein
MRREIKVYTQYCEFACSPDNRNTPSHTTRILIIDDNRDFANILCSLFRHLDYDAYTACSEKQAVEKMERLVPDLVFCDIGLPNRGAYRIAQKIRSDFSLYHIYLVALTYYTPEKVKTAALDLGYDFCVSKPIQTVILESIFEKVELRKSIYGRQKALVNAG